MSYNRPNIDGLSRQEREVIGLWDEGLSMEQIAAELDLDRKRVSSIVSYLSGAEDQRLHASMMFDGSARLLAGMVAAGLCAA